MAHCRTLPFRRCARSVPSAAGDGYVAGHSGEHDPLALARPVRETIRALDPDQPIARVEVLLDLVAASVSQPRSNFVLLSVFAATALSLAMIGVYGVLSSSVVQRSRELGIRVALGGRPRDIQVLIVRDGLRLAGMGLLTGALAAVAVARTLRSLLFGIGPGDAVTFVVAAGTLLGVGLLASYIPARRAAHVDPITALRAD